LHLRAEDDAEAGDLKQAKSGKLESG